MFNKIRAARLSNEQKSVAIAKVLGEPVGFDMSESALKVKNLLLGLSIILLCMVVGGVSIGKTVSFLGVSLEGITANKMVFGLLVSVCWVSIHYCWYAWEIFQEWRLRLTGKRVAFRTGPVATTSDEDEAPGHPKQATLYNWWKERHGRIVHVEAILSRVDNELVGIQEKVDRYLETVPPNYIVNISILSNLISEVNAIKLALEKNDLFVKSNRIEISLYRFDKWFWFLISSQNLRVMIVDLLLPIGLSLAAISSGVLYFYGMLKV